MKSFSYCFVFLLFALLTCLVLFHVLPPAALYNRWGGLANGVALAGLLVLIRSVLRREYGTRTVTVIYILILAVANNLVLSFWTGLFYALSGANEYDDAAGLSWILIYPVTIGTLFLINWFFWRSRRLARNGREGGYQHN